MKMTGVNALKKEKFTNSFNFFLPYLFCKKNAFGLLISWQLKNKDTSSHSTKEKL